MKLVLVALRSGAALEVAHKTAFVGHQKRSLKLAGVGLVDSKVGAQLHGAAHPLGNVAEGSVGKHGAVKGCVVVVGSRNHGSEVLFDQLRVVLNCLTHGAKNHALLGQGLLERGGHRDRVHDNVHGHSAQTLLLVQADSQLFKGFKQLRVYLVEAANLLFYRGGVVAYSLKINFLVVHVCPVRLVHFEPNAVGLKAPLRHPLGLHFFGTNTANHVFAEARIHAVRFNV